MNLAYPFFGDLLIDQIESPNGTMFGMVHMPGRNHVDPKGRVWRRDLAQDLDRIEAWGATGLVTLVEELEFSKLGVPGFAGDVAQRDFGWFHMPIPDMQPPGNAFAEAWSRLEPEFRNASSNGRIVVHCAGGLGRTGTFIAKLLVEAGMPSADALAVVRQARPGAVETRAQEDFIFSGLDLGQ
jgi:protein-tyrosine phosphatase